jgi:Centromere DNA-binding protein complex CBF3 subunit, domain 2
MDASYLVGSFPMRALRCLAGFSVDKDDYFLLRNTVIPSESLCKQVFPQIEISLGILSQNSQPEIAGTAFLNLMARLRIVILQDVVALKKLVIFHVLYLYKLFLRGVI